MLDAKLCYLGTSFIFATLAMVDSPIFFSFHLFDIVFKSQDLQNVWNAISQNGRSILMTLAFLFIVVYVYAIMGYEILAQQFGARQWLTLNTFIPTWIHS